MLSRFKRKKADNFVPAPLTGRIENEPEWWENSGSLFCNKEFWRYASIYRIMWRGKNGRVILRGILPKCKGLVEFPEGATLEVLFSYCGDISRYDDDQVAFRFTDCRVRNKWVPRAIAQGPDETDQIKLYVEIECEIEVVLNG